jgi:DNA-binding NarL/FixJ family response regulator
MTERIRVFVVDDHALFRSGVRAEIGDAVDIVGDVGTVDEAIVAIRATAPDVVLLDVHLPNGGGKAILEGLADDRGDTKFLALSVSDAADDVIGVIRAGARGYVTKTITVMSCSTRSVACEPVTQCSHRASPGSCSMRSPARRPWHPIRTSIA